MTFLSVIDAVLAGTGFLLPVREQPAGSNAGQMVEAILASTGNSKGAPWCAAAVYFVGSRVLGKDWPLPKTASCDILLEFARRNKLLVASPKRGDVFLILKTDTDAVHTGFVLDCFPQGKFTTREGNTSDPTKPSTREGWGFFERTRGGPDDPTHYAFIRWSGS